MSMSDTLSAVFAVLLLYVAHIEYKKKNWISFGFFLSVALVDAYFAIKGFLGF
jgi:hypothetical protein